MELAIVSDSHIPNLAEAIPDPFRERIADADHVIHAGDFQSRQALATVRDLAADLTAVHGNADPPDLGLPTVAAVELEGVTFVVTHGTLDLVEAAVYGTDGLVMNDEEWKTAVADTARARTRRWDGEDVVGVGGHIHTVVDEIHDGVRLLNPGTVTGSTEGDDPTMLTVDVDDSELSVTLHEG